MQPVNALQTMEGLKELAEKFLAIYPQLQAALNGQVQTIDQAVESHHVDPEQQVSQLLQNLGIPIHIKGFSYLKTAIKLLQSNESILFAMTKELYPAVAKIHETTPSRVERAMRHAIELMDDKCYPMYSKNFVDQPTNSMFLAWCVEYLRYKNF